MKISAVILALNNNDVLVHSIPMLKDELKGIDSEIIIVDNGSQPKVFDFDNISIIRNETNRGISIGKNQGIERARGEHVFLLDGDILPVRNSVLLMSKWLDDNYDKDAIGMYPNRFCQDRNNGHFNPCESYCEQLFEPVPHKCACLFYGMYHRRIFDNGLRMDESGEYGKEGYGWEDHDFFMRMKTLGIQQYVAHINHVKGRYHHRINSSIRVMGDKVFRESLKARAEQFKRTWGDGT